MERIRLYTQKINPYAQKVARALNYKKVPYERVESDDPDDLRRWSPVARTLPVLELDGHRVADSAAILRFLEERFPNPPLLSRDPKIASQQERMAEWSDTSFVWYWNRWRAARFPQPGDEKPANPSLLGKLGGSIVRAFGGAAAASQGELREMEILGELANRLDDLIAMLGDRPFFQSDELSVADLSVFGMLEVMRDSPMTGGGELLRERPRLLEYMERVHALTRSLPQG